MTYYAVVLDTEYFADYSEANIVEVNVSDESHQPFDYEDLKEEVEYDVAEAASRSLIALFTDEKSAETFKKDYDIVYNEKLSAIEFIERGFESRVKHLEFIHNAIRITES